MLPDPLDGRALRRVCTPPPQCSHTVHATEAKCTIENPERRKGKKIGNAKPCRKDVWLCQRKIGRGIIARKFRYYNLACPCCVQTYVWLEKHVSHSNTLQCVSKQMKDKISKRLKCPKICCRQRERFSCSLVIFRLLYAAYSMYLKALYFISI